LGFLPGPEDKEERMITENGGRKRTQAPFKEEYNETRIERWKRLRRTDVHESLQEMMGEQARFRGIQEPAIKAIMAGESPVVAVIGTGGEKSLLFILPAYCSRGGMTVIMIPLIALRRDMKRRCDELGLRYHEWENRQPGNGTQIMLMIPESAVGQGFRTFLNRMRATQQLERIVIDEYHVVLNNQMDFRK
jgi:superfamily II DNA helicase RecQ